MKSEVFNFVETFTQGSERFCINCKTRGCFQKLIYSLSPAGIKTKGVPKYYSKREIVGVFKEFYSLL